MCCLFLYNGMLLYIINNGLFLNNLVGCLNLHKNNLMVLSPIYSYKSLSYKIVIKEKKVSELTNNLLGLVPKNEKTYGSTLGLRLSKSVRNSYYFNYTSVIFSQIIGHLLGDGCLTMS